MASYLILGAGKFGRLALQRLARQDAAASFLVVDTRRRPWPRPGPWRSPRLSGWRRRPLPSWPPTWRMTPPWDWLIPMVPVHVACAWLLAGPLNGLGDRGGP